MPLAISSQRLALSPHTDPVGEFAPGAAILARVVRLNLSGGTH